MLLKSMNLYNLSSYEYELPKDLIASHPLARRDESRLMLIDRKTGKIDEMRFYEIADLLNSGDQIILNDTKVLKARLKGLKTTGAAVEIFLLRQIDKMTWETLGKPGRKLRPGDGIIFNPDLSCNILETLENGNKIVQFECTGSFWDLLERHGQMPLPHYMQREASEEDDERYQTVYAAKAGAMAAPTAGLHFTPELLNKLRQKGVDIQTITLHVGLGTFKPVQVDDIREHLMHSEIYHIDPQTAHQINQPRDRHICVGTTTCRTLESMAARGELEGETDIFIYPGYQFQRVNSLLTNFHLPKSSLLMLVCAFGGYDLIMEAYREAVKRKFRFYSYGDAMLIL